MQATLRYSDSSLLTHCHPPSSQELKMKYTDEIRLAQRAQGPATVMAIGTATPTNSVDQHSYPDFFFRITNSEHMIELKQKFQRMCKNSKINNRYLHLTEDILKDNPSMCDYKAASLNARQDILTVEIPKLGEEAARKAILEWGQPKSSITHLVFCSTAGVDAPGADFQLLKLLGLNPSVKRCMMYQQGCFGGGTALRMAKDLAENNRNARVLVVCCEITVSTFHGPSDEHHDNLLGQALFSDGAGAAIVGSDPIAGVEKPLFQMIFADQTIIPDSADAVKLHTREQGLTFHLQKSVCPLIAKNIESILKQTIEPVGISDWNELFWIVHPGGPAILDEVEKKLNLDHGKMDMSRQVLKDYGNMAGATVIFIMDKMRKRSAKLNLNTSGEGLDWGVLLGFGPGITVEAVVLHSVQT